MSKLVIFTENNARVLVNPPAELLAHPRAVLNPDLSAVRGIPPHFWKLEQGRVLPMDAYERDARISHHDKHGVNNSVELPAGGLPAPISLGILARITVFIKGALKRLLFWRR